MASGLIPDEATRLAALKRGEIDIAYSIRGELGEAAAHPGLTLKPTPSGWRSGSLPEQWDPKSPWHDQRVRHVVVVLRRRIVNCWLGQTST